MYQNITPGLDARLMEGRILLEDFLFLFVVRTSEKDNFKCQAEM